jgi:type I restriction enzyme S subunit
MNKKANHMLLPKLRFPEFRGMREWAVKKLKEVAENLDNLRVPITSSERATGDTPYYGASGVVDYVSGFIFNEDLLCVSEDGANLVARTYPIAFPISGKTWVNNHAHVLKFESAYTQKFVEVYLNSIRLDDFITGMAQPKLNKAMLDSIPIPYPDILEQQKIADCLSSLDELIAAQARRVDALKTHKKGLMQQLFPHEGETQPRLRFPEFRAAGKWKKMTLGSAANFYNGRAFKQEELLEAGKYKVLRVGNFFTNNNWYHSNLELDETKYCEDGDLLYAWSASFGPRVWHGEKTIYHYHIWKVVEQPGIDRQFLFIILEHETERMKAKTTNGLGIMHITKGAIESWESFFPGLAEQKKIADRLMTLDSAIGAEARKLESFTEHKRGMMQQLFPSIDDTKI